MANNLTNNLILSVSLVTKAHPGAGRSPGVVDLPVARDPLGYPFIPGSMVKGSFRSLVSAGNPDSIVRCLFGPPVEEAKKHAGSLSFSDLYPLFFPAPSSEKGIIYATSPYLLSRAAALLRAAGREDNARILENLTSEATSCPVGVGLSDRVSVGGITLTNVREFSRRLDSLKDFYDGLNPLYASFPPNNHLIVVPESIAITVIEGLLHRITRVRLNRDTKTVEHGGLWTEEYLPWGTLLIGLILDTGFKANGCTANPLSILRGKIHDTGYVVLGGKETVGAGLAKYRLLGESPVR